MPLRKAWWLTGARLAKPVTIASAVLTHASQARFLLHGSKGLSNGLCIMSGTFGDTINAQSHRHVDEEYRSFGRSAMVQCEGLQADKRGWGCILERD